MYIPDCPYCSKPMKQKHGSRGKFWGCSRFPNCRGTRPYVEEKPIKLAPGSAEQTAIWKWMETGTENGMLPSCAGTGKTYTIVNGIVRLKGKKVAVFSFNNHIIKELNEKLEHEGISWARGVTFNSFGNGVIRNNPQFKTADLFKEKVPTILEEIYPDDADGAFTIRSAAGRLVQLCKNFLVDGTDENTLAEFIDKFNININGDCKDWEEVEKRTKIIYELVPQALKLCLSRRSTYDYDDQVWWVVKMQLPVERFDVIMVDECQDTNTMQQALIQMACP